jgi:phosphoglycerate dehydrogenase-like enzyme
MRKSNWIIITVLALLCVSHSLRAEITIEQLVEQAAIVEAEVASRDYPGWRKQQTILLQDRGFDLSAMEAIANVDLVVVNSLADAMKHAGDVDAIVGFCNAELIAAASDLVWVQIYWAGAESCLAVEEIASGEVILTNMQKMSSPVIAEHAIAMALALSRNLPQFVNAMSSGQWADGAEMRAGMMPVAGKRLLVAGLGGIGTEVARLGDALGMHVTGTRNSSRSGPEFVDYVGLSHELNELAADADIIVNALPLTESTKGLLDEAFFAAVKPGAIFVNVGRGQTVVSEALLAALESGQISGAGLDVTDPEPLPADNALWQRDDVIITPHVAGSGGERERHAVLLLENLRRYAAGEPLLNVVDPARGY